MSCRHRLGLTPLFAGASERTWRADEERNCLSWHGSAMNDLLSGQFDIMCDQTITTTNHINAGKIKGYAVTTKFKVSSVPAVADCSIAGLPVSMFRHGTPCGRRGLPRCFRQQPVAALQTALKDQKVAERFASLGTEPSRPRARNSRCAQSHLAAEVKRWDAVDQGGRC